MLAGHCGTILYMEAETDGQITLYPVSMFVGEAKARPPTGGVVYQAVMLKYNLEDIAETSVKDVTNLRPLSRKDHKDIRSADKFYRCTSHESGFFESGSPIKSLDT